jgi:hypothetical protein
LKIIKKDFVRSISKNLDRSSSLLKTLVGRIMTSTHWNRQTGRQGRQDRTGDKEQEYESELKFEMKNKNNS